MTEPRKPLAHGTQNRCFGCGPENRTGLNLQFHEAEDGGVVCEFRLPRRFMGPPGHAHGGVIATILDEAMSKANRRRGVFAMTRHMEVNYLRPVPLLQPLTVKGHSVTAGFRKHRCTAEITDRTGRVLAQGTGLFIEVKPERLLHVSPQSAETRLDPAGSSKLSPGDLP